MAVCKRSVICINLLDHVSCAHVEWDGTCVMVLLTTGCVSLFLTSTEMLTS